MDKYKVFHEAYKYLNGMFIKSSLWDLVEYSDRRFIEDTPTMVKLIWYANRRTYIPYVGYNYVQNNNSLIHTSSKYKDAVYRLLCAKDYVEFFKDKYPKWSTLKLMDRVLNEIVQMKCSEEEYTKYLQILVDCINFYNKEIEERNK